MSKCPFEVATLQCFNCGETKYNVDGTELRTTDKTTIGSFGLKGKAKELLMGGRCDSCGSTMGYVPVDGK